MLPGLRQLLCPPAENSCNSQWTPRKSTTNRREINPAKNREINPVNNRAFDVVIRISA